MPDLPIRIRRADGIVLYESIMPEDGLSDVTATMIGDQVTAALMEGFACVIEFCDAADEWRIERLWAPHDCE